MQRLQLSARAYDRIPKVARTIADLADSDDIKIEHLAEAIHFEAWTAKVGRDKNLIMRFAPTQKSP